MNRAQRRAQAATLRRMSRDRTGSSVRLAGGPMDGWVVDSKAPVLQPEWWSEMPEHLQQKHLAEGVKPGRYLRSLRDPGEATWRPGRRSGDSVKNDGR